MHPMGGLRLCMGGVCCYSVSVCVVPECQCYVCALSTYGLREFAQFFLSPCRLIVHMVASGLRYLHNVYNIYIHYADTSVLTNAIYTVFFSHIFQCSPIRLRNAVNNA